MSIVSRPYQTADPKQCCDRCAFGRGEHAAFCAKKREQEECQLTSRARRAFRETKK